MHNQKAVSSAGLSQLGPSVQCKYPSIFTFICTAEEKLHHPFCVKGFGVLFSLEAGSRQELMVLGGWVGGGGGGGGVGGESVDAANSNEWMGRDAWLSPPGHWLYDITVD